MSDRDLEARLDAVERALTDGETDLTGLEDAADLAADLEALEERVRTLESSVDDLDAAVQAIRGYAGNVRAVNREVERRASAALAKAETVETAIEGGATRTDSGPDRRSGTAAVDGTAAAANGHAGESDGRQRASGHAGNPDQGTRNERQGREQRPERDRGQGTRSRGAVLDSNGNHAAASTIERDHPGGRSAVGDHDGQGSAVRPETGASNGVDDTDQSRRTSQFIERVRDAL